MDGMVCSRHGTERPGPGEHVSPTSRDAVGNVVWGRLPRIPFDSLPIGKRDRDLLRLVCRFGCTRGGWVRDTDETVGPEITCCARARWKSDGVIHSAEAAIKWMDIPTSELLLLLCIQFIE